jgi:hypothetical protein
MPKEDCALHLLRKPPARSITTKRSELVRFVDFASIGLWLTAIPISFPGLTMQAAIFERKAAIATVMVEKYKTAKDMVNAHKQYKIELTSWKKSQALVLKAATAHPLPNADVARAAVQLKVAAEAARVMKQKMDKETDPAKKAVVSEYPCSV